MTAIRSVGRALVTRTDASCILATLGDGYMFTPPSLSDQRIALTKKPVVKVLVGPVYPMIHVQIDRRRLRNPIYCEAQDGIESMDVPGVPGHVKMIMPERIISEFANANPVKQRGMERELPKGIQILVGIYIKAAPGRYILYSPFLYRTSSLTRAS